MFKGNEKARHAILDRSAALLRRTRRFTAADLIEACKEPGMQLMLEAGVLFQLHDHSLSSPHHPIAIGDDEVTQRNPALPTDESASKSLMTTKPKPHPLHFSTTATFDEPIKRPIKAVVAAAFSIVTALIWVLVS